MYCKEIRLLYYTKKKNPISLEIKMRKVNLPRAPSSRYMLISGSVVSKFILLTLFFFGSIVCELDTGLYYFFWNTFRKRCDPFTYILSLRMPAKWSVFTEYPLLEQFLCCRFYAILQWIYYIFNRSAVRLYGLG